ncbi:MAG: membrane integrity-associated transporter subunit PqiC [Ectothiorhodospira sp.]
MNHRPIPIAVLAVLSLVLLLAGCSVAPQRDAPVKSAYLLEPVRQAGAEQGPGTGQAVIGSVRVAPAFSGRGLVWRLGEGGYRSDFHHEWFSPPRDQVTTHAENWLRGAGVFAAVLPRALVRQADFRLDLVVTELYGDLADPARPAAVVGLQVFVSDLRPCARGRSVTPLEFEARVRLEDDRARTLAAGLSRALGRVLTRLETRLRAAHPGDVPCPEKTPQT